MKTIFCFCFFVLLVCGCSVARQSRVCFGDRCVNVEIADTDEKRIRGLMGREKLAQDSGMLFIFPEEGNYSFWMKNMLIPLDVIWISRDKEVVDITASVEPCNESCRPFSPSRKSAYVLEVNSGFCTRNSVTVGSKVRLKP